MTAAPYFDPELTPERRTEDLLARMTVEEKAGLLFHPYSALAEGAASAEDALAVARAHVQDKGINHFVMVNGATTRGIDAWV